jgi:mono/diheme cytochrome c family protein
MYIKDCAACHGREGQGGIGVTLNSPTFLAVASDEFLAHTISHGRPNTAMPAWRRFDAQQISDLLAFVRRWQPLRNERSAVLAMAASARSAATSTDVSARIGRTLYDANCVTCHGPDGQGDLAPSLATQEFLTLVDDGFLYDTIAEGRPGTGMPAWRHLSSEDVASLIAYIRTWQAEPSRILADTRVDGDWDTGRFLYAGACASCHGEDAEGGVGPQLNNPVFLRGASDAMLGEWISHGKTGTPMRGFVKGSQGTVEFSPRQVDDLVAFVRSLERRPRVSIAKRPSGRPELGKLWYAVSCASCHGDHGEGASGPALSNPGFLHAASDGFLMATLAMGRDGTEMRPVKKGAQSILSLDSDQVNDLVAYLRSWEIDPPTTGVTHRFVVPWDLERGRRLYVSHCSGCHGENGRGEIDAPGRLSAWAPNLNNTGFLAAASDGFLQATIVRGRDGTAMRSFGHGAQGLVDLSEQDIDDIVAYIRRWSNEPGMPMTIPAGIKTPESDAQAVGGGELHSQQATAPDGLAADATRVPASPLAVHSRTQGDE